MTITKDIIHDLMPLYLAGEASADTRRLIDEYLQANPGERPPSDALSLPTIDPPAQTEMASLNRTRELYNRRATAFAGAIALSCSIFSFRFAPQGLTFLLYRDMPAAAWLLLAAALGIWIHFLSMHRHWLETGLPGATRMKAALWLMGGSLAIQPYAFMTNYQFGINDFGAFSIIGAFAGLAIGRALHRSTAR